MASKLAPNLALAAGAESESSGGAAVAARKGRSAPLIDVLGLPLDAEGELRPGWTREMVYELGVAKCALRSMAMFDGIAPSRREFQLVVPHERVYRLYYGGYTRFVESSGYRLSAERQTVEALARRRAVWDAEKKRKAEKLARRAAGRMAVAGRVSGLVGGLRVGRVGGPGVDGELAPMADPVLVLAGDSGVAPISGAVEPEEKTKREPVYGARLEGCDMVHAPTNEQGVVLLFGMLARKLGFLIEMVQTGYPDCEAKRMGADGKLRKVRIEFEFLSSRFDHNPDECDLIVCWEDDANPTELEVLELKRHVGR
ncbi:MAG: hypothetical protein J0L78_07135 [Planctomycetes bacterium]|nr:hypothetical protein [Planctomycetota bacterium]